MLVPKLPFKHAFDEQLIVSGETALEAWKRDPLSCKDKLRLGYGSEILRAMQELLEENDPLDLNLPLLVMIGSDDQVVTGHQILLDCSKHPDKQLKEYPGGRHNLLQEDTRYTPMASC